MAGGIVVQLKPRERVSIGDTSRGEIIQYRNETCAPQIPKVSYLSVSIIFFHHYNSDQTNEIYRIRRGSKHKRQTPFGF